jgi:hypothetical protein
MAFSERPPVWIMLEERGLCGSGCMALRHDTAKYYRVLKLRKSLAMGAARTTTLLQQPEVASTSKLCEKSPCAIVCEKILSNQPNVALCCTCT